MKKNSKHTIKESDLTEFVRQDLNEIGFVTYGEVCLTGGGDIRCDMFAVKSDPVTGAPTHSIVFEAKLTFNFKVVEQGYSWRTKEKANEVYVLVPVTYKSINSRKFAREVCRLLGLGVMEVNLKSKRYQVTVKPTWCPHPTLPTLYEEQKLTVASNSDNDYVTPYKITVSRLVAYMQDRDEAVLSTAVKSIDHHYAGDMRANRNIRSLIENGTIPDFYLSRESNRLVIRKIKKGE